MEGSVPHASARRRPLIWRGVCPWDKSAITRQRRTSSQSNRRFFGRRLAACAALPASSARYSPSGPVWRAISRHTTEGLRPIKWAIRTWDKPAFTPAMIAARSSTPSIRRHPMISLQTASPLHENCLHPMTLPCIKTRSGSGSCRPSRRGSETMEHHKVGGVVAVCGAQHRQRGVLLSRSFVDRLFADG